MSTRSFVLQRNLIMTEKFVPTARLNLTTWLPDYVYLSNAWILWSLSITKQAEIANNVPRINSIRIRQWNVCPSLMWPTQMQCSSTSKREITQKTTLMTKFTSLKPIMLSLPAMPATHTGTERIVWIAQSLSMRQMLVNINLSSILELFNVNPAKIGTTSPKNAMTEKNVWSQLLTVIQLPTHAFLVKMEPCTILQLLPVRRALQGRSSILKHLDVKHGWPTLQDWPTTMLRKETEQKQTWTLKLSRLKPNKKLSSVQSIHRFSPKFKANASNVPTQHLIGTS